MQDDFFVTFSACFAKGWAVSSHSGVSAIFAVFGLARILAWICMADASFVPVDEMNSVSLFHFESLTCCHFIRTTNIDGFLKSKRSSRGRLRSVHDLANQ